MTDHPSDVDGIPDVHRLVVSHDLADLMTPGVQVVVNPPDAELLGAFLEDALGEDDALASNMELAQ
jgi:hypothetical protein